MKKDWADEIADNIMGSTLRIATALRKAKADGRAEAIAEIEKTALALPPHSVEPRMLTAARKL